jgi:saposin
MKASFIVALTIGLLAFSSMVNYSEAQSCGTCEDVIGFITNWVENNSTDQEIISYLDTVCTYLQGYSQICDAIANQGVEEVIQWIKQNESPETICTQLGLCTSSRPAKHYKVSSDIISKLITLPTVKLSTQPKIKIPTNKVQDPVECSACEEVINVVENWLDTTSNQQEVITAVEVVCTYMPDWESTCDNIISVGVPTVINWIEEYENSTTVCGQLSMCPLPKIVKPQDDCSSCDSIVSMIESYVATQTTEATIESYLDIVCTLVPQWSSACDNIVSTYVPQIITMLEADQTPQDVCNEIGFCSN